MASPSVMFRPILGLLLTMGLPAYAEQSGEEAPETKEAKPPVEIDVEVNTAPSAKVSIVAPSCSLNTSGT